MYVAPSMHKLGNDRLHMQYAHSCPLAFLTLPVLPAPPRPAPPNPFTPTPPAQVRAHGASDSAYASYAARLHAFYLLQCRQAVAYSLYAATTTFLPSVVVAVVLFYGGTLVLDGQVSRVAALLHLPCKAGADLFISPLSWCQLAVGGNSTRCGSRNCDVVEACIVQVCPLTCRAVLRCAVPCCGRCHRVPWCPLCYTNSPSAAPSL